MITYKNNLIDTIFSLLKDKYPLEKAMLDVGYSPQVQFGDLALAFPFQLAKRLKRPPRQVAEEIAPLLTGLHGVERVEIAGAGYINLFLDRKAFLKERLRKGGRSSLVPEESKIIVEHTNINPNKAAHIGHLRNAVLGDTLTRCLKFKGEDVEIQNYVDDTGIQVVDVVFGLMEMEKLDLKSIEKIEERFDYYCWDLYTRVSAYLPDHPEAQAKKTEILHKIEAGEGEEYAVAHHVSRRILRAHLLTMSRLGIDYDLLPCESSILHLQFWKKAFALLKEKKAIYLAESGPSTGCWVMDLEDEPGQEKIIVRSDGTVTYVGKDIAYQLWKFGLLEQDFYYEPFQGADDRVLWISTSKPTGHDIHFGGAGKVYNVIDTRQSYLQKIVVQGLKALDYRKQAEQSVHFSYEMVALSPKSLKELNLEVSDADRDRSFVEVSGRKGLGVKADDLLDRLEEKARAEVAGRNPDFSSEQSDAIARAIAVGALRYFMLKFTRNSLIVFDFDEALSFEGETGPYLQYTVVRINSIFRKLEEREGLNDGKIRSMRDTFDWNPEDAGDEEKNDFWELILYASQLEEEVLRAIHALEFSHLAKFTFNLSQKLNGYYHKYSILSETDPVRKNGRILTISLVRDVLRQALTLMGIPEPERM